MASLIAAHVNAGIPVPDCTSPAGYRTPDEFKTMIALDLFREIPTLVFQVSLITNILKLRVDNL